MATYVHIRLSRALKVKHIYALKAIFRRRFNQDCGPECLNPKKSFIENKTRAVHVSPVACIAEYGRIREPVRMLLGQPAVSLLLRDALRGDFKCF